MHLCEPSRALFEPWRFRILLPLWEAPESHKRLRATLPLARRLHGFEPIRGHFIVELRAKRLLSNLNSLHGIQFRP
jgi:hypothetical protein